MTNSDGRSWSDWRANVGEPNATEASAGRTDDRRAGGGRTGSSRRAVAGGARPIGATDGGSDRGASGELRTFTDETYGYEVARPAGWLVDADADGGVAFEPADSRAAGVAVFVDDPVGGRDDGRADAAGSDDALDGYVEAFLDDLGADPHVHDLRVERRYAATLVDGRVGQVVECGYVGDDPADRWRLTYLFVVDGETGYTVGVDWREDVDFEAVANEIVGSFALGRDGSA